MIIRKAEENDTSQIAYLLDAYRIFYKQNSDIESARVFLKNRFEKEDSVIFVALDQTSLQLIGFVQLYPSFSTVSLKKQWILNDLFVDENFRNNGTAQKLITSALNHVQENSKGVMLVTSKDNLIAQKLYKKLKWNTGDYDLYYYSFSKK